MINVVKKYDTNMKLKIIKYQIIIIFNLSLISNLNKNPLHYLYILIFKETY